MTQAGETYIDIFIKCAYLNLAQIARSGQCFRWKKIEEGGYFVISGGRAACMFQRKTGIRLFCRREDEVYFYNYLDLNTDYGAIIREIGREDSYLYGAAKMGKGIRILRQDLWETIVSFLISQRSNIPRIMKSIDCLCENFGREISLVCDGRRICGHAFPEPEQIVNADLSACRFGYRERYVRQAAVDVLSGTVDFSLLKKCGEESVEETGALLKKIVGVGEKVAACIRLFGLHQLSAFPVDTWIHKMEQQYYGGHFPVETYEKYAGVMQQYLFFRMREEENQRAELVSRDVSLESGAGSGAGKSRERLSGKTLYISDLDGTLLDENARLPKEAASRLNALTGRGLCFTVATARTYATANPILKDLQLRFPMILMNGVMIYDPVSKSCVDAEIIESASVDYIFAGRRRFGVTGFVFGLSAPADIISGNGEDGGDKSENASGKAGRKLTTYYEELATPHMKAFYKERKQKYHKPFTKTACLEEIAEEDIIYLSFCYKKEKLEPFYEYLKKDISLNLSFYEDVYGERLWYLEISHKNASKYHGVRKLRSLLNPDKVVGIGDNLNDIPMLKACDCSCAVGNARTEVKEAADRVIDTNRNLGVVKFLEGEPFSYQTDCAPFDTNFLPAACKGGSHRISDIP